jgi:hypothetical protein
MVSAMNENLEIHKSFKEWEDSIHEQLHNDMIKFASDSLIDTNEVFDKFSSWLLVGSGATAALMIVNLDKIMPYLSTFGLRVSIAFLTLSAFFGFMSKIHGLNAAASNAVSKKLDVTMKARMEEYQKSIQEFEVEARKVGYENAQEPDIARFTNDFVELFPKIIQWWIRKKIRREEANRLRGNARAIRAVANQTLAITGQALSYLLFLIAITSSIHFYS